MPRNENKQNEIKEAAKKYVDEQLELLKKYGSLTRLSKTGYESIVKQVVRASAK